MANFPIQTYTTTEVSLVGFDSLYVAPEGTIAVISGPAITATNSGTQGIQAVILGNVVTFGNGSAATRLVDFLGSEFSLYVGADASMVASGQSAPGVELQFDDYARVTNMGSIHGSYYAIAAYHDDTSSQFDLINDGSLTSNSYGVYISNLISGATIHNTGLIQSTGTGIRLATTTSNGYLEIVNSGTISANYGLYAPTNNAAITMTNSGEISGVDYGIYLLYGSGVTEIFNSGTISGRYGAVSSYGANIIDNSGELLGSVTLGSFDDEVVNTGRILGLVSLGGGADFLDSSGGEILGEIFGSLGDDTIIGTAGNDTIAGGSDDDMLYGRGGDDILDGSFGNDTLDGGQGDDTLSGGSADDVVKGREGHDSILGGLGSDNLRGDGGADTIDGGDGQDYLYGGSGDDSLYGGGDGDTIYGNAGDDFIDGGGRHDMLVGGKGDDTLVGGGGADIFVFRRVGNGDDQVNDFQNGSDKIDLSDLGIQNFNALNNTFNAISSDSDGVVIDLAAAGGSGSIRLLGIVKADLDNSDFIF